MSEYPAGIGAQACSYEKLIHWVLYSNHKLSIHCPYISTPPFPPKNKQASKPTSQPPPPKQVSKPAQKVTQLTQLSRWLSCAFASGARFLLGPQSLCMSLSQLHPSPKLSLEMGNRPPDCASHAPCPPLVLALGQHLFSTDRHLVASAQTQPCLLLARWHRNTIIPPNPHLHFTITTASHGLKIPDGKFQRYCKFKLCAILSTVLTLVPSRSVPPGSSAISVEIQDCPRQLHLLPTCGQVSSSPGLHPGVCVVRLTSPHHSVTSRHK